MTTIRKELVPAHEIVEGARVHHHVVTIFNPTGNSERAIGIGLADEDDIISDVVWMNVETAGTIIGSLTRRMKQYLNAYEEVPIGKAN